MKRMKVLLLLPALWLGSTQLYAHTALTETNPADGAVVKHAPAMLDLGFTEAVQLLKLDIADGAGVPLATGFEASAAPAKTFSIPLPALSPGSFTASWTVLGNDGHRVEGSLSFTVDPGAPEVAGPQASQEPHDR